MRENKTISEVDDEQRGRPMLRLLIGIGIFACAILAFLVIGAMTHRDEGGVTQVKSREEVLEAVQGVPDVIVPELAEAENVSYTVHTGGHGSDTEFVGYGMAWKGSLGERAADYELDCNQTNEKTGSHELYHGVFIENSAYEKDTPADWLVTLRFTLGAQVYTLRGRCDTAGMTGEERVDVQKAVEARLRPILEQIIDKSKGGA